MGRVGVTVRVSTSLLPRSYPSGTCLLRRACYLPDRAVTSYLRSAVSFFNFPDVHPHQGAHQPHVCLAREAALRGGRLSYSLSCFTNRAGVPRVSGFLLGSLVPSVPHPTLLMPSLISPHTLANPRLCCTVRSCQPVVSCLAAYVGRKHLQGVPCHPGDASPGS